MGAVNLFGLLAPTEQFLRDCESLHHEATTRQRQRVKQCIGEQIRKPLRNDRLFKSDLAIAELTGVSRPTIQRIKDPNGDLSHVSTDSMLNLAACLEIPIQMPLPSLKRQLLLEELIPHLAQRRAADYAASFANGSRVAKTASLVERIVMNRHVLDPTVTVDVDAFELWRTEAADLVGGSHEGRRLALFAYDYLDTRPRLNGFTTKLIALSATDTTEVLMPEEWVRFQQRNGSFLMSDAISLIKALRDAARIAWQSVQQFTPDSMPSEHAFVSRMRQYLPSEFRKVPYDILMIVLDYLGLDLNDLCCPCENVGSLALKSQPLRNGIIQLLRGEG